MPSFSGSPTVLASITTGLLNIVKARSVRTRIREALADGIKNRINKNDGYFFNIGEVHVNAPANNGDRKSFPSVDILWVTERYTNSFSGGASLGGFNKFATILLDGHLFEDECNLLIEDIVLMRENFVADIERFIGNFFFIPDESGVETAFNTIPKNNDTYGIKSTEPFGGVDVLIEISYRIEQKNPTQSF